MKNFQVLIVLLASLAQSMIEVEDVAMAEQYFLPSTPLSKPPKITITNINILLTLPSSWQHHSPLTETVYNQLSNSTSHYQHCTFVHTVQISCIFTARWKYMSLQWQAWRFGIWGLSEWVFRGYTIMILWGGGFRDCNCRFYKSWVSRPNNYGVIRLIEFNVLHFCCQLTLETQGE